MASLLTSLYVYSYNEIICSLPVVYTLTLDLSTNAASPKQWEVLVVTLFPGANTFIDGIINYDYINLRYRNLVNYTTFNNSSKPVVELVEGILNYNEV